MASKYGSSIQDDYLSTIACPQCQKGFDNVKSVIRHMETTCDGYKDTLVVGEHIPRSSSLGSYRSADSMSDQLVNQIVNQVVRSRSSQLTPTQGVQSADSILNRQSSYHTAHSSFHAGNLDDDADSDGHNIWREKSDIRYTTSLTEGEIQYFTRLPIEGNGVEAGATSQVCEESTVNSEPKGTKSPTAVGRKIINAESSGHLLYFSPKDLVENISSCQKDSGEPISPNTIRFYIDKLQTFLTRREEETKTASLLPEALGRKYDTPTLFYYNKMDATVQTSGSNAYSKAPEIDQIKKLDNCGRQPTTLDERIDSSFPGNFELSSLPVHTNVNNAGTNIQSQIAAESSTKELANKLADKETILELLEFKDVSAAIGLDSRVSKHKPKRVRRKTQTSPGVLDTQPMTSQKMLQCLKRPEVGVKFMDGSTNTFQNDQWVGMAQLANTLAEERPTNLVGRRGRERRSRSRALTQTRSTSAETPAATADGHEVYAHDHQAQPANNPIHQALAENVPHGEQVILIPVRNVTGQVSLLPYNNPAPEDQLSGTVTQRMQRVSFPQMHSSMASQPTSRSNSADHTYGVLDFEPWSIVNPLHRTGDEILQSLRLNVVDEVSGSRRHRGNRPTDRQGAATNSIRLLTADFGRNTYFPLPTDLSSAILENYPDIYNQFYQARRDSINNRSLPNTTQPPRSKRKTRILSGPPRVETTTNNSQFEHTGGENQVFLTAHANDSDPVNTRELSHMATDMSLPTYHSLNGNVSWSRLYITTRSEPKNRTTSEFMESSETIDDITEGLRKAVRWSMQAEDNTDDMAGRRLSTHTDSLHLLCEKKGCNRTNSKEEEKHILSALTHREVVELVRVRTLNAVPQSRPTIATIDASIGMLERAARAIKTERVLLKPMKAKVEITNTELVRVRECSSSIGLQRRAKVSTIVIEHKYQQVNAEKKLRTYSLIKPRIKVTEAIEMSVTRRVRPVNYQRGYNTDEEPRLSRSISSTRSSQIYYGVKENKNTCQGNAPAVMPKTSEQVTTKGSEESLIDRLRKERREQLLALQIKHGVSIPVTREDNTQSQEILSAIAQPKDPIDSDQQFGIIDLIKDLVQQELKKISSQPSLKPISSTQHLPDTVEMEVNADFTSNKSKASSNIPDGLTATQQTAIVREKSAKATSTMATKSDTPEQAEILCRLDVLQDQQRNIGCMIEKINKVVELLENRPASTGAQSVAIEEVSSFDINSDETANSVDLSRRSSVDRTVVLSVNKKPSQQSRTDIQQRMNNIISDWTNRRDRFRSVTSLHQEISSRAIEDGADDPVSLRSKKCILADDLKTKVTLLKQAVKELETRLSGRQPGRGGPDSLPMLLDIPESVTKHHTAYKMTESEIKFKEIEDIYNEVVEKLGATTKLYNDYRKSMAADWTAATTPRGGQTQRNSLTQEYSATQGQLSNSHWDAPSVPQINPTSNVMNASRFSTVMQNSSGAPQVIPGTPQVIPSTPQNIPGTPQNFPGTPQLFAGSMQALSHTANFSPGTPQVIPGTSQVAPGTPQVVPGTPQVVPGTPQLVPGTPQFYPGTPHLIPGTPQFFAGTPHALPTTSLQFPVTPVAANQSSQYLRPQSVHFFNDRVSNQLSPHSFNMPTMTSSAEGGTGPITAQQMTENYNRNYSLPMQLVPVPCMQTYSPCAQAAGEGQCSRSPSQSRKEECRPEATSDLGATEMLLLLADGYLQRCEGLSSQNENKAKLLKLRKKIIMNKHMKPKMLSKIMDYLQRIGGAIVGSQYSCEIQRQPMHNSEFKSAQDDASRKDVSLPQFQPSCTRSRSQKPSYSGHRSRAECEPRAKSTSRLKSCLVNGLEAVSVGKVVPVGKLSNSLSNQGMKQSQSRNLRAKSSQEVREVPIAEWHSSIQDANINRAIPSQHSSRRSFSQTSLNPSQQRYPEHSVTQYNTSQFKTVSHQQPPVYQPQFTQVPNGSFHRNNSHYVPPQTNLPQINFTQYSQPDNHQQQQYNQSQYNQNQINQSQYNHPQMSHSQYSNPQMSQSQYNQLQMNQSSYNRQQADQSNFNDIQQPTNQSLGQTNASSYNDSQMSPSINSATYGNQSRFSEPHFNKANDFSVPNYSFPQSQTPRYQSQSLISGALQSNPQLQTGSNYQSTDSHKMSVKSLERESKYSPAEMEPKQESSHQQYHQPPEYLGQTPPSDVDLQQNLVMGPTIPRRYNESEVGEVEVTTKQPYGTSSRTVTRETQNQGSDAMSRSRLSVANTHKSWTAEEDIARRVSVSESKGSRIRSDQGSHRSKRCLEGRPSRIDCEELCENESMLEKLERKSLNIPEGTLVTDGMNVYYIMKPNENADSDCPEEEVIVNIPIKGNNIVKPTGDCRRRPNKCDCKKELKKKRCSSSVVAKNLKKTGKCSDVEEVSSDECLPVKPRDCGRKNKSSPVTQKKKAKSLSTVADFEKCVCSNCVPNQEEWDADLPYNIKCTSSTTKNSKISNKPENNNTTSFATQTGISVGISVEPSTIQSTIQPVNQSTIHPTSLSNLAVGPISDNMAILPSIVGKKPSIVLEKPEIEGGDELTATEQPNKMAADNQLSDKLLPPKSSAAKNSDDELSISVSRELTPNIEGKVLVAQSAERLQMKKCLEQVFRYLDIKSLTTVSEVCQEWKTVSRQPSLWRRVDISNERVYSKFLETISAWCTQVNTISLQGIKTPKKRRSVSLETFLSAVQGSLEIGLEAILKASNIHITTISLIGCSNLFTDGILMTIASHCPMLKRLAYVSAHCPPGRETLWGLGSGCRVIDTLLLPAANPSKDPMRFDDTCCEVIGRAWPNLKVLCIGGKGVTAYGLEVIADLCQNLQILELNNALPMTLKVVKAMTGVGLRNLELVELNGTEITSEGLKAFGEGCPKLSKFSYEGTVQDETARSNDPKGVNNGNTSPVSDTEVNASLPVVKQEHLLSPDSIRHSQRTRIKRRRNPRGRSYTKLIPRLETGSSQVSLSKEEKDRALEDRILAAKRLNAETAQQLANNRRNRLHKLQPERSVTSTRHRTPPPVPPKPNRERKTLEQLKEELRSKRRHPVVKSSSTSRSGSRQSSATDTKLHHISIEEQVNEEMTETEDPKSNENSSYSRKQNSSNNFLRVSNG